MLLWLKRCVVPAAPKESLSIGVVYPTVLLPHGHPLSLLPAMVCDIQNGLRILTERFCKVKEVRAKDGSTRTKTPNLRIELPYTYFMAWFVLHFSILISPNHSQTDHNSPMVRMVTMEGSLYGYDS